MPDRERRMHPGRRALPAPLMPWPFAGLFGLVGIVGAIKTVWTASADRTLRYIAFGVAAFLLIGGIVLLRTAIRGWLQFQARMKREESAPGMPWLWSRRPWDPEKSLSLEPQRGVLQYGRFPFFLGSEVTGSLTLSGTLAASPRLALTVRHLEEEPVGSISGGRNAMNVYSSYEHRVEVEGRGGGPVAIQLPLPADPDLTIQFGPFNRYWALDVESVPPGGERATFLLPIYPSTTER